MRELVSGWALGCHAQDPGFNPSLFSAIEKNNNPGVVATVITALKLRQEDP